MRYLIATLLVLVVVLLVRRAISRQRDSRESSKRREISTLMVQCHLCGVYLPQDDAVSQGAFHYCSEAHRNLDSEP